MKIITIFIGQEYEGTRTGRTPVDGLSRRGGAS